MGWAHRLVHDVIHGVDIGYRGRRTLRITSPNFTEGEAEDRAVSVDIANEVSLGRIAGPFASPPFPYYRCSPIKTVAKKGSTTKFRVIHHLSYPHGRSVNSCTADWPCPLARFAQAVDIVRRLGRGCFMAKVDVRAAYRTIAIRPADWPLLGMCNTPAHRPGRKHPSTGQSRDRTATTVASDKRSDHMYTKY